MSGGAVEESISVLLGHNDVVGMCNNITTLRAPRALPLLSCRRHNKHFPSRGGRVYHHTTRLITRSSAVCVSANAAYLGLISFVTSGRYAVLAGDLLVFGGTTSCPGLSVVSIPKGLGHGALSFAKPSVGSCLRACGVSVTFVTYANMAVGDKLAGTDTRRCVAGGTVTRGTGDVVLLTSRSGFNQVSLVACSSVRGLSTVMASRPLPRRCSDFYRRRNVHIVAVSWVKC